MTTRRQGVLGIDVGTSGTKAVLVDPADGGVLASATRDHPVARPRPGWSEQHPDDWWNAARDAVRAVRAEAGGVEVAAVGLTGQMHGLVLLDDADRVLRPAILWNDQRTAAECAAITARVGVERVVRITGNPMLTGFTAPKIAWVRTHEPETFARVARVMLPKDFVRYRLSDGDTHAIDVADGSGTGLFDVRQRTWSETMLDAVGVARSWLGSVAEGPAVVGEVGREAAGATDLRAGTPLVAGAGDQAAQAIGSGLVEPGVVAVTVGTSGVVFAVTEGCVVDPEGILHAFGHAVPRCWHLMGVMLSAGGSVAWWRSILGQEAAGAFGPWLDAAGAVEPGARGLNFLPYLSGERTPHADPHARGVFFGLEAGHGSADLTRAVLEGVAFGLRDGLERMVALGLAPTEVRVSGGGARHPVQRRILADVLGHDLVSVASAEVGAAFGAAVLAAVGAGAHADLGSAAVAMVRTAGTTSHDPATHEALARAYARHRRLYPLLRDEFVRASS